MKRLMTGLLGIAVAAGVGAGTFRVLETRVLAAQEREVRAEKEAIAARMKELTQAARHLEGSHREASERGDRDAVLQIERERDEVAQRLAEIREHAQQLERAHRSPDEARRGERERDELHAQRERAEREHAERGRAEREHAEHGEHRGAEEPMARIHAMHEAAERLAQGGLPDLAHELHQRAEQMERELMAQHHAGRPGQSGDAHQHVAEQLEQLRHEVRELHHKLDRIMELLEQNQRHHAASLSSDAGEARFETTEVPAELAPADDFSLVPVEGGDDATNAATN
ncbi:MAG: hypothetical protein KDA96_03275 [Planctomycetaceae bacterium]|nr:hypothetical protein [Planctomycetaceae bacterium]